ncbi:MAG: polysaccharide deacetylase family protein [Flavobacteriales bacterium]
MSVLKKIARGYVFPIFLKIGLDKILRGLSKPKVLHITYHGVVNEKSTFFSPRHIDAVQFEKQIIYLRKNFTIISVQDGFDLIRNKTRLKKKYISISFDDGFMNNLKVASKILEKHEVPATIYVSGVCVENEGEKVLWSELIAALLYFYKNKEIKIDGFNFVNLFDASKSIYINDYIKSLPYYQRDQFIERLDSLFNLSDKLKTLPREIWELLKPSDIEELSKSPWITIGSHGYDHFNLGQIDISDAENEMLKSKHLLESILDQEVDQFAYPDGSYTEEVKKLARLCGYKIQYAVQYKFQQDESDDDISDRFGISSTTTFESNILSLNYAFFKK